MKHKGEWFRSLSAPDRLECVRNEGITLGAISNHQRLEFSSKLEASPTPHRKGRPWWEIAFTQISLFERNKIIIDFILQAWIMMQKHSHMIKNNHLVISHIFKGLFNIKILTQVFFQKRVWHFLQVERERERQLDKNALLRNKS